MKNYLFFLLFTPLFISCSGSDSATTKDDTSKKDTITKDTTKLTSIKAIVEVNAKSNSSISGTVIFTEIDGKVTMKADIEGLSAGNHAIHIHAKGDCSADDGTSAGGHWNPTNVNHGKWNIPPFHIGDIGNIEADSNGNATISRITDLWCIGCEDTTKNIVGKAIIIHEGPDDFSSQPSGAAGPRIGCGEITLQ